MKIFGVLLFIIALVEGDFEKEFDHVRCQRVQECKMESSNTNTGRGVFCPATADYTMVCLPKTNAGQSVSVKCETMLGDGISFEGSINRTCGSDGVWSQGDEEEDPSLHPCIIFAGNYFTDRLKNSSNFDDATLFGKLAEASVAMIIEDEGKCRDLNQENKRELNQMKLMNLILSIASMVFALLGFIILMWLYPFKHDRINIHRHVFSSLFLMHLTEFIWLNPSVDYNERTCSGLYLVYAFFYSTTVVWLLNEGIHHFWIIFFPYKDPIKFKVFLIIGYGIGILQTFGFYLPAGIFVDDGFNVCKTQDKSNQDIEWNTTVIDSIFYNFSFALFLVNVFFFLYLMVILRRKIQRENNSTSRKSWRLARSWFILLFLLGGGFYFAQGDRSTDPITQRKYRGLLWFQNIAYGLQAFFLFLTQIVFSKDVMKKLSHKWRIYQQKNVLPPLKPSKSPLQIRMSLGIPRMNSSKTYVVNSLKKTTQRHTLSPVYTCTTGISNDPFSGLDLPNISETAKKLNDSTVDGAVMSNLDKKLAPGKGIENNAFVKDETESKMKNNDGADVSAMSSIADKNKKERHNRGIENNAFIPDELEMGKKRTITNKRDIELKDTSGESKLSLSEEMDSGIEHDQNSV